MPVPCPSRSSIRPALAAPALAAAILLGGCSIFRGSFGSGGTARLESVQTTAKLEARLDTSAYLEAGEYAADIYMTDLSPGDLLPQADLRGTWGQFIHIHLFIEPSAGDTPISRDACSAIVRHLVISDGQIGLYGGGGFLQPSGKPGDPSLGGSLADATMKPITGTAGFVDRLGSSVFSGSVGGKRDAVEAERLRKGLQSLLLRLPRGPQTGMAPAPISAPHSPATP
jgi:hypothetical protein